MALEVPASGTRGGVGQLGGCAPSALMDAPRAIGCTVRGGAGGSGEAGG